MIMLKNDIRCRRYRDYWPLFTAHLASSLSFKLVYTVIVCAGEHVHASTRVNFVWFVRVICRNPLRLLPKQPACDAHIMFFLSCNGGRN